MSGNQSNTNCTIDNNSLILILVPAYILVISVLGIVLNVFVLMVFCLHKKACTVAEIYLSNLAAADLALVCCLPFWAHYIGKGYDWPFSESLCKMVPAVINMNAFCSIYFLVLVSIDRYVAVVHPLSRDRIRRPLYAKLGCLVVWGLGVVFALPVFFYRKSVQYQSNVTVCRLDYTSNQYLASEGIIIMFIFIIPVSISSFYTVRISRALRERLKEGLNARRTERKATTLILAVLLAFLICWVPFHLSKILYVCRQFGLLGCHPVLYVYQQVSAYLSFFNSVLNPILYVIAGKNFRKRAKNFLKQRNNQTHFHTNSPDKCFFY